MYQRKIVIISLLLLFSIHLTAQITFVEKTPPTNPKPGWDYLKDIFMMPYDSTNFEIYKFPISSAYKKYIGQKVFLLNLKEASLDDKIFFKDGKEIFPRYDYNGINKEKVINTLSHKYYTITDMVGYNRGTYTYSYPCENKPLEECDEYVHEGLSYFVFTNPELKDTIIRKYNRELGNRFYEYDTIDISIDTIKYGWSDNYILVGGYIKLKEKIGQNIVFFKYAGESNSQTPLLGTNENAWKYSTWKIKDVSIAGDNFIKPSDYYNSELYNFSNEGYRNGENVCFILEQIQDDKIVNKNFCVKYLTKKFQYISSGIEDKVYDIKSGVVLEKDWNNYISYINQKRIEYNHKIALAEAKTKVQQEQTRIEQEKNLQQIAQKASEERALRQQKLENKYGIEIANKIMTGKFEIGMSKVICREIEENVRVVDQTATTETWKIGDFFSGESFLYFSGDKLIRIIRY